MHTSRSAVVFRCSGKKRWNDFSDRPFVASVPHQLYEVLPRLDHIVQSFIIKANVNFQGREAKLILVIARGADVVFFFRHHCSKDLYPKISRFLPEAAFDLANRPERTE